MCQQGASSSSLRDEVRRGPMALPDAKVCMAWSGLACGLALPGGLPSNAPTYLYK